MMSSTFHFLVLYIHLLVVMDDYWTCGKTVPLHNQQTVSRMP